jgi:catechol 2,3-dioxygenase-like lactoylglutathione lyase family enzyme
LNERKEIAMRLRAKGLSHLGLRVTDLARAKSFYVDTLGAEVVREIEGAVLINMYGILIGLYPTDSYAARHDHFDPFRVGLDHLALAVEDASSLEGMRQALDAEGVPNHGVEEDPETHDKYISFHDPDGIAWELYWISSPK